MKKQPKKGHQRFSYGYLIKEGIKGVFKHSFMSFAAICILVACLLIMGTFTLIALNIDVLIDKAEEENEILAYVDESLEDSEARSIGTEINKLENIADSVFITREEAFNSYKSGLGQENTLLEGLEDNPLRHRYRIHLKDLSKMSETVVQLRNLDGIAKVNARVDISKTFIQTRSIINQISIIITVILFVISLFIISNTIRLTTIDRRDEIEIMKYVGATNGFIRIPFIIQGMIIGLIGSAVAFGLQWLVYNGMESLIKGTVGNAFSMISFESMLIPTVVVFLLVGQLVGILGSAMAIRRYLKV